MSLAATVELERPMPPLRAPIFAGWALVLPILFSPVSQLAPSGALAKAPMAIEVGVLLALLLRWFILGLRPGLITPLMWLAVAITHAAVSIFWAIDERICVLYGIRALHWALWVYGLYSVVAHRVDLLTILRVLYFAGTVAALVGVAQLLLPSLQVDFSKENTAGAKGAALVWESELSSGSIVRVTGTQAHPLGLALLLSITLTWTPALLQAARKPLGRLLVAGCGAIQLVGLGLTYSRMAALALALGVILYIVRGGVKRPGPTLAILAALGVACLPLLPSTMIERLLDPSHLRESESLTARLEMQLYGNDLAQSHGFAGLGYGCFGPAFEATAKGMYVEQARYMLSSEEWVGYDLGDIGAHNTYLEVLVEQGWLGIALMAAVFFTVLRDLARVNRRLERGSLDRSLGLCMESGAIALMASMAVLHIQEATIPWVWLGLVVAFLRLHIHRPEAVA